jgi:hypothetical protein
VAPAAEVKKVKLMAELCGTSREQSRFAAV